MLSWNVRAICETYAGCFHHRSTTDLYAPPPTVVASDVVTAAGADALVAAAQRRLDGDEPVEAVHLTDLVLAAQPQHREARAVARHAHEHLRAESANFWQRAWLRRAIDKLV